MRNELSELGRAPLDVLLDSELKVDPHFRPQIVIEVIGLEKEAEAAERLLKKMQGARTGPMILANRCQCATQAVTTSVGLNLVQAQTGR